MSTVVLERAVQLNEIVLALSRYGLTQRDIAAAAHVSERTVYAPGSASRAVCETATTTG